MVMYVIEPDFIAHADVLAATRDGLDRLALASANGDLGTVKQLMNEMTSISGGDWFLGRHGGSLYQAVHNSQQAIVEYLMSQGATFHTQLAENATLNKDTATLATLLKYGWNTDEQQRSNPPPVVSYV